MKTLFLNQVLIAVYVLLTTSYTFAQTAYQIQGNVQGLGNAKVYLKKQDNNNSRVLIVDTTRATNGTFTFRRTVPEPDFYTVSIDGVSGQTSFIWDHDVVITGDNKDFRTAEVKGSPLTDEWKKFQTEIDLPYRDQLMTLYNERQQSPSNTAVTERVAKEEKRLKQEQMQKVQQYIRTNRNSMLSLYLLNSHWTEFPKAEAKALYDQLDQTFKNHSVAKRLDRQLR